MTPEQQAAYVNAQAAAAMIEALGMQAENKQREIENGAMAFRVEAFYAVIDKYGLHHDTILSTFGR